MAETVMPSTVQQDRVVNNLTTTVAGYVLDARQGKALSDQITPLRTGFGLVSDLNNAKTTGLYVTSNSATNRPADFCMVYVFASSEANFTQIAMSLITARSWVRAYANNIWQNWKEITNGDDVAKLISKVPIATFSSTGACIMGNYISGYGCSSFIPLPGASDYSITVTNIGVFGQSGDKKTDFTVGTRYKSGFAINSSVDYSGKYVTVTYTATIS